LFSFLLSACCSTPCVLLPLRLVASAPRCLCALLPFLHLVPCLPYAPFQTQNTSTHHKFIDDTLSNAPTHTHTPSNTQMPPHTHTTHARKHTHTYAHTCTHTARTRVHARARTHTHMKAETHTHLGTDGRCKRSGVAVGCKSASRVHNPGSPSPPLHLHHQPQNQTGVS